jgi:hypothetical protein
VVRHLVDLLVALVELLEAEADRLRLGLRRLLVTGAMLAVGATLVGALLLAASGLLLWSLYLALAPLMTDALAALTVGLLVWLVVGGGAWLVADRIRRS